MQIVCPNCNARYLTPDEQIGPNGRRVRCARCAHVWRTDPPPPAAAGGEDAYAAPGATASIRVEPLPRDRLLAPRAHRPQQRSRKGRLAFFVVVGALAAGLYFGRAEVMRLWPPATALYEVVGLVDAAPAIPPPGGLAPDSPAPASPAPASPAPAPPVPAAPSPAAPAAGVPATEGMTVAPAPKRRTDKLEVSDLANEWVDETDGLKLILRGRVTNNADAEAAAPLVRIRLFDRDGNIVRDKRAPVQGGPLRAGESREFALRFDDPGDVARALPMLEPVR